MFELFGNVQLRQPQIAELDSLRLGLYTLITAARRCCLGYLGQWVSKPFNKSTTNIKHGTRERVFVLSQRQY